MNVLSLFDGMSCGQIALNRAGIKYNRYYASEIDKHAIKVTMTNYPNTIQLGSVKDVDSIFIPDTIDLLIGGSPCQGFSFGGEQLNFNDPRSKLFFEFVRLRDQCDPKYFFLENVNMKKEYQDVITRYMGVEPIQLNSSLVSAQNRNRLYWTNIPYSQPPVDRKLMVSDYEGSRIDLNRKLDDDKVITWKTIKGVTSRVGHFGPWYGQRVHGLNGKFPCLTRVGIRELWITEDDIDIYSPHINFCEWLQNVPKDYTKAAPLKNRFEMLGNGWTVDIITHFFSNIQ